MRKKLQLIIFFISLALCGCTRKEQLVLDDTEADGQRVEEQYTGGQDTQEQYVDGQHMEEQYAEDKTALSGQDAVSDSEPQMIYVHVCGAVERPDVYALPAGSRVYEAVKAAGGFTDEADTSYVNQAERLADGVKLVIPTLEQAQEQLKGQEDRAALGIIGEPQDMSSQGSAVSYGTGGGSGGEADGRVNINTASEAELCNIPGIGAVRAAAIVAYRQQNGNFTSVEDIKNVSGIKEGTYGKIKDSITVQ